MSKLWIARDIDGSLYGHFSKKPCKALRGCWDSGPGHCRFKFDNRLFPEVLWKDKKPTEVELIVKDNIQDKATTNSLWVARNRNKHLYAYIGVKPWKFVGYQWFNGNSFKIEDKLFPQITWDDEEPIEVELVIKKKITMDIKNLEEAQSLAEELKDLGMACDLIKHGGIITVKGRGDTYSIIRNTCLCNKINEAVLDRIDVIKQRIEDL